MSRARYIRVVFLFTLVSLLAIIPLRGVGAQEMPGLFPEGDIKTITDLVLKRRGDKADVYFPTVPDLPDGYPVVAVLQGAGVDKGFYSEFGTQLARFGFVVVIPNHFQFIPSVPFPVLFPDQDVILDVFDQMVEEDKNPSELPPGIVDSTRMGLVGHSAGGAASLFAIDGVCQFPFCGPPPPPPPELPPFIPFPLPDEVRAGAFYGTNTCGAGGEAEDPACINFDTTPPNPDGMLFVIDNNNLPVALVQGSLDGISTPDEAQATIDNLDGLRELIPIDGANHYGIADVNNPKGAVPDFSPPIIPQSQSIQEIVDAMGPFLRTYLVITVDNVSRATAKTRDLTWSHTVAAGNDQLLMVGTSHRDGNKKVTGITYGDMPLTQLGFQNAPGNQNRLEMWYLLAPPSGTANVVVSLSDKRKIVGGAVSFNGVNQKTPFGVFMSAKDQTATASLAVVSAPRELVFTVVAANGDAKSLTVDDGQTQLWNTGTGTSGGDIRGAGSSVPEASLVTMTLGKKKPWAIGAVPLKPAVAP